MLITKWFGDVTKEAKTIDPEKFEPRDGVGPGDRIIGRAGAQSKKLYALAKLYKRRASMTRKGADQPGINISSKKRCLKKAREMEQKAVVATELFQVSMRKGKNFWAGEIALRKGWKIVRVSIEEIQNCVRFFANAHFKKML